MKIFSNFDTNYKNEIVSKYIQEYGESNILVVQKSKLFLLLYITIPTIVYAIFFGLIIYAVLLWIDIVFVRSLFVFVIGVARLSVMIPVMKKYIDYKLDFVVIVPKGVFLYNQTGILNRNTTSLNIQNIRSIVVNKKGLIYSMFDNGDMIILSEGTDNDLGEAKMQYVYDPEAKREKIKDIFAKIDIANY